MGQEVEPITDKQQEFFRFFKLPVKKGATSAWAEAEMKRQLADPERRASWARHVQGLAVVAGVATTDDDDEEIPIRRYTPVRNAARLGRYNAAEPGTEVVASPARHLPLVFGALVLMLMLGAAAGPLVCVRHLAQSLDGTPEQLAEHVELTELRQSLGLRKPLTVDQIRHLLAPNGAPNLGLTALRGMSFEDFETCVVAMQTTPDAAAPVRLFLHRRGWHWKLSLVLHPR